MLTRMRSIVHLLRAARVVLWVVLAATVLPGCQPKTEMVIATDAVFPPFHFVAEDGLIDGYEIALAWGAVDRIGARPEVVRAPSYADLFTGLEDGTYDVIAASTGITAERAARYAFTRPTFTSCLVAVVRTDAGAPRTRADLFGRRIAASLGTTSEQAVRGLEGATLVGVAGLAEGIDRLRAGDVDALVIDEFEAVPTARADPALDVVSEPVALEAYAFVLRKEEAAVRDVLDEAIDVMAADGTIGVLRARYGLRRDTDWPVELPF